MDHDPSAWGLGWTSLFITSPTMNKETKPTHQPYADSRSWNSGCDTKRKITKWEGWAVTAKKIDPILSIK